MVELLWTTYAQFGVGLELWLATALVVFVAAGCSALSLHVLSRRKPSGSAVAWIGLIWMSPLIGWSAYGLLGVNRVQRKAQRLLRGTPEPRDLAEGCGERPSLVLADELEHLAPLARAGDRITEHALVPGNTVVPLRNGDQAYLAMLQAIDEAQSSVAMITYILDDDPWGRRFEEALLAAHRRGVAVRLMVDGIGAMRGRALVRRLRQAGVPVGSFLWSWMPWQMALINLRNHRKLLIADGRRAFTGGINIREAYVHQGGPGEARDLHCQEHDRYGEGIVQSNLASLAWLQDRVDEADTLFRVAMGLHAAVGAEMLAAGMTGSIVSRHVSPLLAPDGPPHDLGQYYLLIDPGTSNDFAARFSQIAEGVAMNEGARMPGQGKMPRDPVDVNDDVWALTQRLAGIA